MPLVIWERLNWIWLPWAVESFWQYWFFQSKKARGIPEMEPAGLEGTGLTAKAVTSRRAQLRNLPQGLHHWCSCPCSGHSRPPPPGDPPKPAGRSGSGSNGVTALAWAPLLMKPCSCPQEWSLSLPVPCSSCTQTQLAIKAKCSWSSSPRCQALRLGA